MASDLTRLQTVTEVANTMGRSLSSVMRDGSTTFQTILDERYEWAKLRIARAYSFPEMDVEDRTTADTVADTRKYTYSTLFGANARVKDILSVVIEDGTSSCKLTRKLYRRMDKWAPYPDAESTRRPVFYVDFAESVELFPIPDAAYDIHTRRSDYDARASADGDTSTFQNKDDVIVIATVVEAYNFLQEFKDAARWDVVFKNKLIDAVKPHLHPSDREPEGRAFNSAVITPGDFWLDPLVMENI